MVTVQFLADIKHKKTSHDLDCPKNIKISKHTTGVSLRFGAGGHLDLAPGQNFYKALKILKIYSSRDTKSSQAKLSSRLVN